jgi:formylglycine-generating enzyme required for sulfatase activity
VIPVNCNLFFNGSNAVQIAWNAYPGKSYVIQSTTNLARPWQNAPTAPPILTTTTNWLSYSFPVAPNAQFYKVVKLDTDGPEAYKTAPFDGAIGVGLQAVVQAWLRDDSGVNTNTLAFAVGTNAPVSLTDSRLSYSLGLLTYAPGTNEFLGTNGQIVTATLSAADMLGNQTTNFAWSFQLELAPVFSSNIVVMGSTPKGPAPNGPFPKDANPCNLTLVSTIGDDFTLTYSGSCCLTNGMVLMNADPYVGYTRTVVSFTDYPASNTVVALTRPTLLAEALQAGTLTSSSLVQLTNSTGGPAQAKGSALTKDFPLQYTVPLGKVLYQDADGFLLETTSGSQLILNATLQLAGNFQGGRLSAFQAQVIGSASVKLDVHAKASASKTWSDTIPLLTPAPTTRYYLLAAGWWPVWVDVKFEVNALYSATFDAAAEASTGVNAVKTITLGKKWSAASGWQDIFDNPPVDFSFSTPTWQVQGTADVVATLQPKVTVLVYSAAGVEADLDPYLELTGSVQANPYQWDLGLYAGLDAKVGLDLKVWDKSWGELPSLPLTLIPKQTLWHASGPPSQATPPQITVQPQSQTVSAGSSASFSVQAQGSAPLSYRWYKNGLYLTDDTRITGSGSSALRIGSVQSSDAGGYQVRVSNQAGSVNSGNAVLTVPAPRPPPPSPRMAWIPPGTFVMGSPTSEAERFADETQHTVTLTKGFYMGKYAVTQGEYLALMGNNPSYFTTRDYNGNLISPDLNRPVDGVSWDDATSYCAQLTAQEQAAGRLPSGWVYRLPTESEREYACRAGTTTAFHYGNALRGGMANFCDYYEYDASIGTIFVPNPAWLPRTTTVGSYQASAWGLYDMHGNVWEWCRDWYGSYLTGSVTDPQGSPSGSDRVFRGGSWVTRASGCRSAWRHARAPGFRDYGVGFRSVLALDQP